MANYSYIISTLGPESWVANGDFDKLGDDDKPEKYSKEYASSLQGARGLKLNRLLASPEIKELRILKFSRYAPYLCHGEVK